MNKLNRKLEYALMAVKHMSQKIPGELTSAKEVSDTYGTPFDATARVMQAMAQKGLLRAEQGAFGGYQITKDLSKITMFQLLEIIEGPTSVVKCLSAAKEDACGNHVKCNLHSPVQLLQNKLNDFYSNITLKELLLHG
jgi:Rrf2 family protein